MRRLNCISLLMAGIIIMTVLPVWAGQQGPLSPTDYDRSDEYWTSPEKAYTSNNEWASSTDAGADNPLCYNTFGFSVPTELDSVKVECEFYGSDNININLFTTSAGPCVGGNGVIFTSPGPLFINEAYVSYMFIPGEGKTFFETYSFGDLVDFNDNLSFSISGDRGGDINLDHLRVTAYYTDATGKNEPSNYIQGGFVNNRKTYSALINSIWGMSKIQSK